MPLATSANPGIAVTGDPHDIIARAATVVGLEAFEDSLMLVNYSIRPSGDVSTAHSADQRPA